MDKTDGWLLREKMKKSSSISRGKKEAKDRKLTGMRK